MLFELISTFILGLAASWIVIPRMLKASCSRMMLDRPNARKIHEGAVPRIGGLCIFLASAIAVIIEVGCDAIFNNVTTYELQGVNLPVMVFSLLFLSVFGVLDDMHGLRYRTKFAAQIIAGLLMCASGVWIKDLHGLFGVHGLPVTVGWPFTVLAVVSITNAINFIDGIDGLASGLCGLALIYFAFFFICAGLNLYAIVCVAIISSMIPFVYYNMFGSAERHNKIFMGDTGSLILGLLLCVFGVVLCNNHFCANDGYNPMVLAFAPMILPCYDVVRVVYNRLTAHHNPFEADKGHIHHKYLRLGKSQHFTLVCVLITAVVMTLSSVWLTLCLDINIVLIIEMAFWAFYNIILTTFINKKTTQLNKLR